MASASGALGPAARRAAAAAGAQVAKGSSWLSTSIKACTDRSAVVERGVERGRTRAVLQAKDGAEATLKLNTLTRDLFGFWVESVPLRWGHAKAEWAGLRVRFLPVLSASRDSAPLRFRKDDFAVLQSSFSKGEFNSGSMQQFVTGALRRSLLLFLVSLVPCGSSNLVTFCSQGSGQPVTLPCSFASAALLGADLTTCRSEEPAGRSEGWINLVRLEDLIPRRRNLWSCDPE